MHTLVRVSLTVVLLGAFAAPAGAAGVLPATAQCIRDNAAKVEAAVQSLNEGVEFLVNKVCAPEMAAQLRKDIADMQADKRRQDCERQKAQEAAGRPHVGSDACAPQTDAGIGGGFEALLMFPFLAMMQGQHGGSFASGEAPALAAKLLLDLRSKRQEREGRH